MAEKIPNPVDTPPGAEPLAPTPAAPVTADEIVAPLGAAMPPVTEGADDPIGPQQPAPPAPGPDLKDSRGVKFNAERHAVDDTGKPKKNSHGNFYSKTTGRPPGAAKIAAPAAPSFSAPGGAAPAGSPPSPFDEYDAAAEVYLQAVYGPVIIAFSDKARPDSEEHAALKTALANYLRVKKITEPSPGWSLLFVVVAVGVKKSAIPEVKDRAVSLGDRIKSWFSPKPLAIVSTKTEKSP